MPVGLLLLLGLAVYRATVFVTTDQVTARVRRRLIRRFPPRVVPLIDDAGHEVVGSATAQPRWPVVLTSCDWCLSLWLAAAACVLAHMAGLLGTWPLAAFSVFATAAVAGICSEIVSFLTRP